MPRCAPPSEPVPLATPSPADTPQSRYRIAHYGHSRHWALYDGEELLAVTVYRRGAATVQARLQALERQLAAGDRGTVPPPPPAAPSEAIGPAVQAVQQRRQVAPETQAAMVVALVEMCGDDPARLQDVLVRHFRLMAARTR